MKRRILSILLVGMMLMTLLPSGLVQPTEALAEDNPVEEKEVDLGTFEDMGFQLNTQPATQGIVGSGRTTMNTQNELFLDFNASSNYGYVLRDNINMNRDGASAEDNGAYKYYKNYRNGDWADLKEKHGYRDSEMGGQTLASYLQSHNTHLTTAYATSVAYRSSSGKLDRVAKLYLTAAQKRKDGQVRLEMKTFNSDGTITQKSIKVTDASQATALAQDGRLNSDDYQALFEVEAGDFDGDGIDEIAVYAADSKVRIYSTKNDYFELIKTIQLDTAEYLGKVSADDIGETYMAPYISLAAGDLKKNQRDELAIGWSEPSEKGSDGAVAVVNAEKKAYVSIYGFDTSCNPTLDERIDYESTKIMYDYANYGSVGVAIGDLSGDAQDELVISSYYRRDVMSWPDTYVQHVAYDNPSETYEIDERRSVDAGPVYKDKNTQHGIAVSPLATAIADLNGTQSASNGYVGGYLFVNGSLFTYDPDSNNYTKPSNGNMQLMGLDQLWNISDDKEKSIQLQWFGDVVVGNFNGDGQGREQIIAVHGTRVRDNYYYYQIGYFAMYGQNLKASCEGVIAGSNSYLNNSDKKRAGAFLTIAAPDTDNDSTLMEYQGSDVSYSKPEIQAVLQSAPYFQDVEDTYSYLANGTTAYGTTAGNANAVTASISASVGVYTSAEASFFGSAEMEAEFKTTMSYEHETSWETVTSVERSASPGDDYAIVYTIPYRNYYYRAYDPNNKNCDPNDTSTWIDVKIEQPLQAVIMPITVDKYDEIAERTVGLQPIRGTLLTSTAGEPSTYTSWPSAAGRFNPISVGSDSWQLLTNTPGTLTTVSKEVTTTQSNGFSVGIENSVKMGAGGGFLGNNVKVGVTASYEATAGTVRSKMSGATYTGAVDNMPEEASEFGAYWQFGTSEADFNGEKVMVIGYKTKDVYAPPTSPKNLSITNVTTDTMSLQWDATAQAAAYELYLRRGNGSYVSAGVVPGTAKDEDGTVTYNKLGLTPNTDYTFYVRAVSVDGIYSLPSATASGTTLPDNLPGEFNITKHPQDTTMYVGGTAIFSTEARCTTGNTVGYSWERYNPSTKRWETIPGARLSSLRVNNVSLAMDGQRYRCGVNLDNGIVIYTQSAQLFVDKADSVTTLSVTSNGANADGKTVNATQDGSETTKRQVTTYPLRTAEKEGKVYTLMAVPADGYNEGIHDADGNVVGQNYVYTEPYVWMDEDGNFYAVDNGDNAPNGSPLSTNAPAGGGGGDNDDSEATDSPDVAILYDANTTIAVSDLVQVHSTTPQTTTQDVVTVTQVAGDKLTLSATVKPATAGNADPTGSVTFNITNLTTGETDSVKASISGNTASGEYIFAAAGSYSITASYDGDSKYSSSTSNEVKVNAADSRATLSINGGNLVYGSSLALEPVVISKGKTEAATNVTYTVTKSGKAVSGVISNDRFRPTEAGKYLITATKDSLSTTTTVQVYTKTMNITANDKEDTINGNNRSLDATVTGLISDDRSLADGAYTLASQGTSARKQGTYPIEVTMTEKGEKAFANKYTPVLTSGTFTLTQPGHVVAVNTGPQGKASLTYEAKSDTGYDNGMVLINGSAAPENSRITINISTDAGYTVSEWRNAEGKVVTDKNGGTNGAQSYTGNQLVIEDLKSAQKFDVSFKPLNNALILETRTVDEADNAGGNLTAVYMENGQVTDTPYTGGEVHVSQNFRLTAEPKDGYVISKWEIETNGNSEVVKAADGTSNYTRSTYDIGNVGAATTVRVTFEKKGEHTIKVKPVDKNGVALAGDDLVSVSGKTVTKAEDGTYSFTVSSNENPVIQLKLDSSLLVESWTDKNGEAVESQYLTNNGRTLSLYAVDSDHSYTVLATTPNAYKLTFGGKLGDDNNIPDEAGKVTATVINGGEIASGDAVTQASDINVTATAAEGYEIAGYTISGNGRDTEYVPATAGAESQTLQVSALAGDTDVSFLYRKQPQITIVEDANASISVTGTQRNVDAQTITSGQYVDVASTINVKATPADGYVIDSIFVNGKKTDVSGNRKHGEQNITVENVRIDTEITVVTVKKPIVTITNDEHATLSVTGTRNGVAGQTVNSGMFVDMDSALQIKATPEDAYVVDSILVDGEPTEIKGNRKSGVQTATFAKVEEDVEVTVVTVKKPVITYSAGDNGTLTATVINNAFVDFGTESVTFTASPDHGFVVDKWTVTDVTSPEGEAIENSDDQTFKHAPKGGIQKDVNANVTFRELATKTVSYSVVNLSDGPHGGIIGEANRKAMDSYHTQDEFAVESGDQIIYEGGSVTLTAQPDEGWRVKGWMVDGKSAGNDDSITIKYADLNNTNVTVQYEKSDAQITFADPEHGKLTATVDGTEFISGGSSKTDVVFAADADENYVVKEWRINNEVVDDETDATFTYKPDGSNVNIAVVMQGRLMAIQVEAEKGGSVDTKPSADTIRYLDEVTITATPDRGYVFDGWYIGKEKVSDDAAYTFTAETDATYTAHFSAQQGVVVNYLLDGDKGDSTMVVTANDVAIANGDAVSGGQRVLMTVNAADGYRVKEWRGLPDDAVVADDKSSASFIMSTNDVEVTAMMEAIPVYAITLRDTENGKITAQVDGKDVTEVREGTKVTFTAVADPNWMLKAWTEDAEDENTITFDRVIMGDITVGATFVDAANYTISYYVEGRPNGEVEGTNGVNILPYNQEEQQPGGTHLTFTAYPDEDFMVNEWQVNGVDAKIYGNELSLDLLENTVVTVSFRKLVLYDLPKDTDNYTIENIHKTPEEYGDERQIRENGDVTFDVKPVDGKRISKININAGEVVENTDGTWTITIQNITEAVQMQVEIEDLKTVTFNSPAGGHVEVVTEDGTQVANGDQVKIGEKLTVKAVPDRNYSIKSLTINEEDFKSGDVYEVLADVEAVTINVAFSRNTGGGGGGGGGGAIESFTLNFDTNGGKAIDSIKKTKGATVQLAPYTTTREGYTFDGWYSDKELKERVTEVVINDNTTVYAKWQAVKKTDNPFVDVKPDDYFHDAVIWAVDNKITAGMDATHFAPEAISTRAQAVTFLWRVAGSPAPKTKAMPFADVASDAYYHDAVLWAVERGITVGTSETTFSPDMKCSRAHIVSFLWRQADKPSVEANNPFADVTSADYYYDAVMWAVDQNITAGTTATTFSPDADCNRAQIVSFLYRQAQNAK